MKISKVNFGSDTLIDLTGDTVTAGQLKYGATAHGADGEEITGTAALVYSAANEELTLPDWAVIING